MFAEQTCLKDLLIMGTIRAIQFYFYRIVAAIMDK